MKNEGERLIRRYIKEVWNEGRVDVIDEIVAPDFMGYGPGPGRFHGPRGIRSFVETMNMVWEMRGRKARHQIKDLIVQDDRVAVRMTEENDVFSYPP